VGGGDMGKTGAAWKSVARARTKHDNCVYDDVSIEGKPLGLGDVWAAPLPDKDQWTIIF